jgi:hypothetical protein
MGRLWAWSWLGEERVGDAECPEMGLGSFGRTGLGEKDGRLACVSRAGAECSEMGLGSFGTPRTGESGRRLPAAQTDEPANERSRLKAGCSQDWLPHKSESISTNTKLLRLVTGNSLSGA